MAVTTAPRSVSDATRFTPTTPHASSKPATGSGTSSSSQPRFSRNPAAAAAGGSSRRSPPGGGGAVPPSETAEQRVARLRAAHLAAKNAEVSQLDRVLSVSRGFFDSAHKLAVFGLISFTAIAGLVTVYTTYDMLRYNRKRKAEFAEAQQQMRSDSLEAARLAYMRHEATDEQIALVEEANARAGGGEGGVGIFKMPSVLGAPAAIEKEQQAGATLPAVAAGAGAGAAAAAAEVSANAESTKAKKSGGISSWFSSSLKKQEEGEDVGTSERRFGWESLSEEDDGTGVRNSDLVRAIEDKQAYVKDKARQAFQKERENQQNGGPLDRVGATGSKSQSADKKGWWPW